MKLIQAMGVATAQDLQPGVIGCDAPRKANQTKTDTQPKTDPMSQIKTIRGKVTDEMGNPLSGATILNASNPQASGVTNADGYFTVNASSFDTIRISYVGFETMTFVATAIPPVVKLKTEVNQLSEVVLIADSKVDKKPSIKNFIERNQAWIMIGIAFLSLGATIYFNNRKVKKVKL